MNPGLGGQMEEKTACHKSSNRSPWLLLVQVCQSPSCIWDPASIWSLASITV